MTDPTGVRERKKTLTHDALVDAARELVRERCLDAVTVEEICERAGVARRTFFNYFDKKEDAVLGWNGAMTPADALATFVAGGPHGALPADVAELVAAILESSEFDASSATEKGELVESEPKLLARQVWWFERELSDLEAAFSERAGAAGAAPSASSRTSSAARTDDPPGPAAVGAFAVVTLLRSAFRLWELDGHTGAIGDHLPEARRQLRAVLGD